MIIFKNIVRTFLFSSLLCLSVSNSSFAQTEGVDQKKSSLPLEELQMFTQVFGKIKSDYVDAVDDRKMLLDAINGILAGLDPHSSFLEPESFRELRIDTEGQFGGVGIEVTMDKNQLKVIAPIDDTPADNAGILAGDIILKIDGQITASESLSEAVKRMRGKIGSKIILTIGRKGEDQPFDVEVVRDIIQLTSVRTKDLGEPGFSYMRITSFQAGTAASLEKKIIKHQKEHGEIRGFILDLRNNPGGVLGGAVDVSDLFLDASAGVIVQTHGRVEDSESSYKADSPDIIKGAPMVILVNSGSASASEIVAGALQDHQRAIIFGTQTFGKGSVQTITPMGNGSALKITTARYFTPSGRSIQETGITPDIISEATETKKVTQNHRTREVDLARHLANPDDKKKQNQSLEKGPDKKETVSKVSNIDKDSQLRDALNLLKGIHLANAHKANQSG
ncbi:MAG: S41 family peptidase [Arenicellales bacterium]